jgi:hypothetical protein
MARVVEIWTRMAADGPPLTERAMKERLTAWRDAEAQRIGASALTQDHGLDGPPKDHSDWLDLATRPPEAYFTSEHEAETERIGGSPNTLERARRDWEALRQRLTDDVNAYLARGVSYRLEATGNGETRLAPEPGTLVAALFLQCAQWIAGVRSGRVCARPECGALLGGRSHQQHCSDRCRASHYESRKAAARALDRAGWKPTAIASEIGASATQVAKWLRPVTLRRKTRRRRPVRSRRRAA